MNQSLTPEALAALNKRIADRNNVFYWQTDRYITPEQTKAIWADRHGYFTDQQIITAVNRALAQDELVSLEPFDPNAQITLGNVNSVRIGMLRSGKEVVIRCHPRGVQNGYFYAESLAAEKALQAGLPAYRTYAIHELEDESDFAFQVIQKLPGKAMQIWLEEHPKDDAKLTYQIGVCMARLHMLKVKGFGPFNNAKARHGELVGLHPTFADAVRAGLDFNLQVLTERDILTAAQATAADKLMSAHNPLLACTQGVIIHNDFADWNALTDGQKITGMIDWDECVAGDPIADLACWSTFFDPARLDGMLKGYWSMAQKPQDFEDKFELLRLRYVLSKMTLRLRRYEWNKSEDIKKRIENGTKHLAASLAHFNI